MTIVPARFRCALLALGLCVLAACTIERGVAPDVGKLDSLMPERSGRAEVLRALGEPTGKGFARFPDDRRLRRVWSYEFVRVTYPEINSRFLLVFFRDGRFDGYMWSASGTLIGGTP